MINGFTSEGYRNGEYQQYLELFAKKARADGFADNKPSDNWLVLRGAVNGNHLSLSVTRDQIQINLNNTRDADRTIIDALLLERAAVEERIGECLTWEKKPGVRKSAARATLACFPGGDQWDRQHAWALETARKFDHEFASLVTIAGRKKSARSAKNATANPAHMEPTEADASRPPRAESSRASTNVASRLLALLNWILGAIKAWPG